MQHLLRRTFPAAGPEELLLSAVPPGDRVTVVHVGREHEPALAREGIVAGGELEVESAVPLGGPLILLVGTARVALGRAIARSIVVEPVT